MTSAGIFFLNSIHLTDIINYNMVFSCNLDLIHQAAKRPLDQHILLKFHSSAQSIALYSPTLTLNIVFKNELADDKYSLHDMNSLFATSTLCLCKKPAFKRMDIDGGFAINTKVQSKELLTIDHMQLRQVKLVIIPHVCCHVPMNNKT
ncbi:hypothetical protein ACJX0J_020971, partial [Zea mays]